MRGYVLRGSGQAVFACFGITLIVFAVLRLAGDPVLFLLPLGAGQDAVDAMRRTLGFDQPLATQYWIFIRNALQGDFGTSLFLRESVANLLLKRMPATIELAGAGMLVAVLFAVPLGIIAALRRGGLLDMLASSLAVAGQAMPMFWLGILLIVVFGVRLGWLPISGRGTINQLILPAITLGLYLVPMIMRLTRASMLEVLHQDFVRTARAKGLRERTVLSKHALRNAGIPMVTMIGYQFSKLLGGAVVVEFVFAWPGLGSLAVDGIRKYDYPIVQASVLFLALSIVFINLLTDIVVARLDPRISLR